MQAAQVLSYQLGQVMSLHCAQEYFHYATGLDYTIVVPKRNPNTMWSGVHIFALWYTMLFLGTLGN